MDLRELSARLGLSPTTVSRALNGYRDVSEATRQRVAQAAEALGYRPNQAARRLATGRADAVGIVYPVDTDAMGNPLFLEMIAGVSDRLEPAGFDMLLAVAREDSELRTYERLIRDRRVDGLIVAHTRVADERLALLAGAGMPFVGYGRSVTAADFPWVEFDNEGGSVQAVRELARLGHRRIAYVHGPLGYSFAHERHAGFLRGMAEAGLAVAAQRVVPGADRIGGHAAARRLLALRERPSAILVDNNLGGVGIVRALLESGLQPGREASVVVWDGVPPDTPLGGLSVAAVLRPTPYEAGATLADMLLTLVEGRPLAPRQVLRPTRFVPGSTLGPAPAG